MNLALCGALAGAMLVLALNVWNILPGRSDASDPFIQVKAKTIGSASAGAILSVLRPHPPPLSAENIGSWKSCGGAIRVGVGSFDEEGQMVLVDGTLVAILVYRTSPFNNPELQRSWASVLVPSLTERKTQPERVLS